MLGLGEVLAVGKNSKFQPGQFVAYLHYGAFSEYVVVDDGEGILVPSQDAAFMSIALSGLTASLAFEKEGDLKPGKNVLVTAAAGGAGQFAVQIAKLVGCHVIGTFFRPEKAEFLTSLGCDRTVNYREEKLDEVLKKEYPKGVDVVYEGVGKEMFDAALKNIAEFDRIIVLGQIAAYGDNDSKKQFSELLTASEVSIPLALLVKSASLRGFWLTSYMDDFPRHIQKLSELYEQGKIQVNTDKGGTAENGPFVGLEKIVDALGHMYARKNVGKVIVELH
ncbi:prostaglandin reductase-3-like [Aplysia californica]|uniref:Prostaglandin reductase-3-like n=1 Tax=Aplysia californica TaxID=6500 RepID=A0ABM0JUT5_APLCA|nr:prostaglandin reductase-3-like [Aplysia californica]